MSLLCHQAHPLLNWTFWHLRTICSTSWTFHLFPVHISRKPGTLKKFGSPSNTQVIHNWVDSPVRVPMHHFPTVISNHSLLYGPSNNSLRLYGFSSMIFRICVWYPLWARLTSMTVTPESPDPATDSSYSRLCFTNCKCSNLPNEFPSLAKFCPQVSCLYCLHYDWGCLVFVLLDNKMLTMTVQPFI